MREKEREKERADRDAFARVVGVERGCLLEISPRRLRMCIRFLACAQRRHA